MGNVSEIKPLSPSKINYRTNLYYLQSKDFGKNWQIVDGSSGELPLPEIDNRAGVQGLIVWGMSAIEYLLSKNVPADFDIK
ncbi:MAG: hypothetical protein AB2L20_17140 [Mangrovibacterium sp.]